jgi:membrane-bound lytic murein transglycosylase F
MRRKTIAISVVALTTVIAAVIGLSVGVRNTEYAPEWLRVPLKAPRETGEIVFLTVRGPTTTQDIPLAGKAKEDSQTGFEHDLATLFANELGAKPKFVVMSGHTALVQALKQNRGHIAAAGIAPTPELRQEIAFGSSYKTVQYQFIYRSKDGRPRSLKDAAGKRVLVIADTPAHDIMRELTGDFPSVGIEALPHATHPDDLLARLERGEADYAIVDAYAFQVTRRLHPDLASAFNIGRERRVAWAFSTVADFDLQQSAVAFFEKIRINGTLNRLIDRYYGHVNRINPLDAEAILDKVQTTLPKLRAFFQEAQQLTGIDWRIIAAVGYQESHWDPLATSPTGVRGLMMLTDDTADRMGVKNRLDARESILGGAKYLLLLRDTIPDRIQEPDRTWLALAAYNQGYGHLEDARVLTAKLKMNADSWLDVRKNYPKLKEPNFYESLKHGYARGDEAVQFVENIRNYSDILTRIEPLVETNSAFAQSIEDAELLPPSKRRALVQRAVTPTKPSVAAKKVDTADSGNGKASGESNKP